MHGDISNRPAPTIAFRVDGFLVRTKESKLSDKVANFILGKNRRAELDLNVLDTIQRIFRHTDMSVDLVIDKHELDADIEKLIEQNCPHNRLVVIEKPVEIAIKLNNDEFFYYVDDDEIRNSVVGHRSCLTLNDFRRKVMLGVK